MFAKPSRFPSEITAFHGLKVRIKPNGQCCVGELSENLTLQEVGRTTDYSSSPTPKENISLFSVITT
jgi:hypothetical protein